LLALAYPSKKIDKKLRHSADLELHSWKPCRAQKMVSVIENSMVGKDMDVNE
jgi:hypothetical protein